MSLTAQQLAMRTMLGRALSGNSPLAANPSDAEVLGFFRQLFTDAIGAAALSVGKSVAMAAAARGLLSGNFIGIANPSDTDVVTFWGQLNTDAAAAATLTAQRYLTLRSVLRSEFSNNYPGVSNPSEADMLGYFTTFAGVLGAAATRASTANNTFGTATTFMNRTGHIARDTISSIQVAWANWASVNPSGYSAPAGTLTVTGSVEYPAGTFTQLKWSGAASVVVASGANPLSDAAAVSIPSGATFWIRSFHAPSANICYGDGVNKSAAIGDLCMNAGSSDMTMGGAITDNSTAVIFPAIIVGQTAKRTCLLLGHSLVDGLGDQSADATGDNGNLQRPLNPQYGTIRSACVGETVQNFLTKAAQRVALSTYCTAVVIDFCANDLNGGRTAAQIIADLQSLAALFTGKQLWLCTAAPVAVTTTDAYATLVNQTVGASEAQRQLLNTAIRAGISGYTGFIEMADQVEQARSGKWKVDGTANKYTADGTHPSAFADQQITITFP